MANNKLVSLRRKLETKLDCECLVTLEADILTIEIKAVSPYKVSYPISVFEEFYDSSVPDFADLIVSMYYNND